MNSPEINPQATAEYEILVRNAQDAAARRMQSALSIAAADAVQRDLAFQLKRIDALSTEQLLLRAAQRAEREGKRA